jgi:hypothetical protein
MTSFDSKRAHLVKEVYAQPRRRGSWKVRLF